MYYQCVPTTTSEQLYADINVSAVVKRDSEKSITPGILVKAIENANNDIKTVCVIDEIDKARDEVDSYFLSFLQSGAITTSEYGTLQIDKEKMKNLTVVVCKNRWRELDGSLLRRLRRIELEEPSVNMVDKILSSQEVKYDRGIRNFAIKLYASMLEHKDNYSRLPSIQEIITALNDDTRLKELECTSSDRISNIVSWFSNNPEDKETLIEEIKQAFDYDLDSDNSMDDSKIPFLSLDEEEINKLIEEEFANQNSEQDSYDSILERFVSKSDKDFLPENIDLTKIKTIGYLKFDGKQYDIPQTDGSQLKTFFKYLQNETNPNSNVAILNTNEDNFIGAVFVDDSIFLISGNEVISPKQFVEAMAELGRVSATCTGADSSLAYNYSVLDKFKLYNLKLSFVTGISEAIAMQDILLEPKKDNEDILVGNKYGINVQLDTNEGIVKYRQSNRKGSNLESTILDLVKLNPELRVLISNVHYSEFIPFVNENSKYKSYNILKYICGENNFNSKYCLSWYDDDPEEIPIALKNTIKMINMNALGIGGIDDGAFIRNIPEVREYFDNLQLKAKDLNNEITKNKEDKSEDLEK